MQIRSNPAQFRTVAPSTKPIPAPSVRDDVVTLSKNIFVGGVMGVVGQQVTQAFTSVGVAGLMSAFGSPFHDSPALDAIIRNQEAIMGAATGLALGAGLGVGLYSADPKTTARVASRIGGALGGAAVGGLVGAAITSHLHPAVMAVASLVGATATGLAGERLGAGLGYALAS